MNTNAKRLIVTATFVATTSAAAVLAPSSASAGTPSSHVLSRARMHVLTAGHALEPASSATHRPMTPNECIRINGGDFNACNVGNSGRGDLPYLPVRNW